jgi:arginyl-tRNA synthetase
MKDTKEAISELLSKHVGLEKDKITSLIEVPPDPNLGDYAFPCFILAKEFRKSPAEIATELAKKLSKVIFISKEISEVKAINGYLNFFIDKKPLVENIINKILKEKEKYGKGKEKGKIALEHTSLNPNSSPHVGRARNSFIGDSLKKILGFMGFKVETYYYVNDVSKQIAIMALDSKGKETFEQLLNLYVNANKKFEQNPELEKKVFDLLSKFEAGDKKTTALFKKIVDVAVKGQRKILEDLGIKFDKFDYESKYIRSEKSILKDFEKTKRLFKDDEGRLVLNQEGFGLENKMKSPMLVLARSNGTGLYPLRDIAYTLDKLKRCKKTLIVLGEDQKLYFEQIKAALKILSKPSPEVVHYSYVLIQTEEGAEKMSTRKGELVLLEDFMKEAREKAEKEIAKRKTKGDARKVGYGAVKYMILKNDPDKNIIFNWEQALNFEGNTGPYLQYTYARANSILEKSKAKIPAKIKILSLHKKEIELAKKLAEFPQAVEHAYNQLNPSIIANYSFQLCQIFNEFYHECPVIFSKEEEQRLCLVKAFMSVQKSALSLLGIDVLEEM